MADFLIPDWPAPARVRALQTTRRGGVSQGPFASLNLGDHVDDDPAAVAANRGLLSGSLPAAPCWLRQVHGTTVVDAGQAMAGTEADAALARQADHVCVVMTADCLPILLCDRAGSVVAAAHAGWRGLCAGIVERTVEAMAVPGCEILAWLGPAIGPTAFEVGGEVRAAFVAHDPAAATAFGGYGEGKWLADIYLLARQRLTSMGIDRIFGGGECTVADGERWFSYRRDGTTGRMGSFIWLAEA